MKVDIAYTFERLYREESDSIFRFCLVRVSNREQALDITQETFLRVWKNLLSGEKILNNRAFLFTVAHHLVIDWYRKKKSLSLDKMVNDEKDAPYDPPEEVKGESILFGAEGRFLLGKIKELSEVHQSPVYMRFVEGLSPGEIGKILGISANAASVRVNRGLAELRKKTGYENIEI